MDTMFIFTAIVIPLIATANYYPTYTNMSLSLLLFANNIHAQTNNDIHYDNYHKTTTIINSKGYNP